MVWETMALTKMSARKLQCFQHALETYTLYVLGIRIPFKESEKKCKSLTSQRTVRLKQHWLDVQPDKKLSGKIPRIVQCRKWGHKRRVGRPQKRWLDGIRINSKKQMIPGGSTLKPIGKYGGDLHSAVYVSNMSSSGQWLEEDGLSEHFSRPLLILQH